MKIYLAGSVRDKIEEEKILMHHKYRLHSFFMKKEIEKFFKMKKEIENENKNK